MICLLARVMSFDLMALLLDPSLFRVTFYDLILCIVLLWYSQRFKGAESCICRSQIFLKLKCQLAILQFSNKVKLRGPYIFHYLSNFGVDRMKIKLSLLHWNIFKKCFLHLLHIHVFYQNGTYLNIIINISILSI